MAEELEPQEETQQEETAKVEEVAAEPKEGLEGKLDQNKNVIILAVLALLVAIGGGYMYFSGAEESEAEAQMEIYRAQYFFGKDSLQLALNGNGETITGFQEVADNYGGTKAGNLANFYIAVIKMKEGSFEEAISSLDEFDCDDLLIQSRAYALRGDANLELGNTDEAIKWYTEACENNPTEEFTPAYYLKLGVAYEVKGDKEAALKAYEDVAELFPGSRTEGQTALKYASKLRAELKKN